MHLRIKLFILFGVTLIINVSDCQSGYNLEKNEDVKKNWNSKKTCKSISDGLVDVDVSKNIDDSPVRITKRAAAIPDIMKIGFNGSFPFNITRTKRQMIPSGPLSNNTLMGGTIGGAPPSNGSPPSNGMSTTSGIPLASSNALPPTAMNIGIPTVFNQPAITNVASVPSIAGTTSSISAPGPVVFPPS